VHPSVARIRRVAITLGALADEIVFIGGAIAPLLQTDPAFDRARPTKDVDAVVGSSSYTDVGRLHDRLRSLGFAQPGDQTHHIHRWRSPGGDILDLIPCGAHPGGSGQEWDRESLTTSVDVDLGDGVRVRIASAPVFLALKWAAYRDRGASDPFASHDLEDILALLAARDTVVAEIGGASARVSAFVANQTRLFLAHDGFEDLLAANLSNTQDPAHFVAVVRERLGAIARQAP